MSEVSRRQSQSLFIKPPRATYSRQIIANEVLYSPWLTTKQQELRETALTAFIVLVISVR